jgi:putative endonuclease
MWPFSGKRGSRRGLSRSSNLGPKGEKLARKFLKRRGLKILAENYRCPAGEVDLIALDPSTRSELGSETITFVEVKTRRSDQYTDPESAVDAEKRRKVQKVARYYLNTHETGDLSARFDVIAIVIPDGEEPQINYIPNAF